MKEIIYKSFNQFNYSKKALKVNYEDKTCVVYCGSQAPISYDKKVSTKFINEKIEELKVAGFNVIEK